MPLPILRTITETKGSGNTTSFTMNMPSSRPDGRLYVAILQVDGSDPIADPSGWTRLQRATSGTAVSAWVGRRVGSSEPASYSVSTDAAASEGWSAIVLGFDRFDASTPIDGSSSNTGTSATPTPTNLTTTVNDVLGLWAFGIDAGSNISNLVEGRPAGYGPISTTRHATDGGICSAFKKKLTAGSFGADAGSSSSDEWVAFLVAIAGDLTVPEITALDCAAAGDAWVQSSESGVVLTGVNFGSSKGSGKLELWSNLSGSTKVEQTTTAWGATAITFTVSRGSIAAGRMYAVVTENGGKVSEPFRVVVLDSAPDVKIAQVRVSANTSNGDQDITTSDLGGVTPKAVHFRMVRASADGQADHLSHCVGMATSSTNRGAMCSKEEDGATTSNVGSEGSNNQCLILTDVTSTTAARECAADFVSFLTNGCRINWSAAPGTGWQIVATFFAGSQVQAHVSAIVPDLQLSSASSPFYQDVSTGIGDPDFLLATSALTGNSFASSSGSSIFTVGASRLSQFDVETVEQSACQMYSITDNVLTDAAQLRVFTDALLNTGADARMRAAKALRMRDSGYTLYPVDATLVSRASLFLELILPGIRSWVGGIDPLTSNGSQGITSPGFLPQWVGVVQSMATAYDTNFSDDTANAWSVATFTETNSQTTGVAIDDGSTGSDSRSFIDNVPLYLRDHSGMLFEGTLTSLDSAGWTWNYTTTQGTQRKWWGWAIEGIPSTGEVGLLAEGFKAGDVFGATSAAVASWSEGFLGGDSSPATAAALAAWAEGFLGGDASPALAAAVAVLLEGAFAGDLEGALAAAQGVLAEGSKAGDASDGTVQEAGGGNQVAAAVEGARQGDLLAALAAALAGLFEGAVQGDSFAATAATAAAWAEGQRLHDYFSFPGEGGEYLVLRGQGRSRAALRGIALARRGGGSHLVH